LSRIIKHSKSDIEPLVIGKAGTGKSAASGDDGWKSLAFSNNIAGEIERWKHLAGTEAESRKEDNNREIQNAFQEGYEKGLTDGVQRERQEHMKAIDALFREAKKKSRNVIRNLEIKVINLAVTIAEQIIRKSIDAKPEIVDEMITETMSHIIGNEHIVLKVSAADFKTINAKYNTWMNLAGGAAEFRIEIDKRLKTGDFIVETEGGIIDAVVNDRIGIMVDELLKTSH